MVAGAEADPRGEKEAGDDSGSGSGSGGDQVIDNEVLKGNLDMEVSGMEQLEASMVLAKAKVSVCVCVFVCIND